MSSFNAGDANTTDGTAPGAGVEIVATNATLTSSNSACAAVGSRLCIQDDVFETELSFNDEENYSSTQNQATKSESMPTSFFGISRSGRNKILGGTATCLFLLAITITSTVEVINKNNQVISNNNDSAVAVNPASAKSSKAPSAKTTKAPKSSGSGGGGATTTTTTTTATTTTTTATTTTTTTTTSCNDNVADYDFVEYGACADVGGNVHPYIAFDMSDNLGKACKCAAKCNECVRGVVSSYRGFTVDNGGPHYTCGCHYDYGDNSGDTFIGTGSCQTTAENPYWPSGTGSGEIYPWAGGEFECLKLK